MNDWTIEGDVAADLALEIMNDRRHRAGLSCSDGFCGATDCGTCYGDLAEDENNEIEEE